ncbi:organic cation transporter protein-like [Panulirus ornatus]|uniref:organic cation transporter protein-like n=1 Tax=Panulirus ornatus TaxID=150431 RepID=UPI003A8A5E49
MEESVVEGGQRDTKKGESTDSPQPKEEVTGVVKTGVTTQDDDHEGTVQGISDPETFEDLLELAGTSGRWNFTIIVLSCLCGFVSPFQLISYQFLGATPDHWCHVTPLVEANWTQEQILSFAIPESDNVTGTRSSCYMYDYNYTSAALLGYEKSINNPQFLPSEDVGIVACSTRDFNLTQYKSTVVTQWDLVCERRLLYSTTQAISQFGKLIGSFAFGYLIEALGRRRSSLLSGFLTMVCNLVAAVSPTLTIYILMRGIITAVASGYFMANLILCLEISSPKQRSAIGGLSGIPWGLGYMVLPGVAYFIREWQWLQAAFTFPTLIFFVYIWILPESPRWLVKRKRYQEALDVLTWAARVNKKTLPPDDVMLAAMRRIREQNLSQDERDETKGSYWKRVLGTVKWLLSMFLVPQLRRISIPVFFCWIASGMIYYGVALSATNLSADPYMFIFLGGLLELPAFFLAWIISAYVGRKRGLMLLYAICAVSIFSVLVMQVQFPQAPVWLRVLFSQSGKMAIATGFTLVWFYTIELYPTKFRSLGTGQASVCARIGSISSPYINDILGAAVVWAPSALFSSVSLATVGICFLLPETRNKTMPENLDYFHGKSKTKPTENVMMDNIGHHNPAFIRN